MSSRRERSRERNKNGEKSSRRRNREDVEKTNGREVDDSELERLRYREKVKAKAKAKAKEALQRRERSRTREGISRRQNRSQEDNSRRRGNRREGESSKSPRSRSLRRDGSSSSKRDESVSDSERTTDKDEEDIKVNRRRSKDSSTDRSRKGRRIRKLPSAIEEESSDVDSDFIPKGEKPNGISRLNTEKPIADAFPTDTDNMAENGDDNFQKPSQRIKQRSVRRAEETTEGDISDPRDVSVNRERRKLENGEGSTENQNLRGRRRHRDTNKPSTEETSTRRIKSEIDNSRVEIDAPNKYIIDGKSSEDDRKDPVKEEQELFAVKHKSRRERRGRHINKEAFPERHQPELGDNASTESRIERKKKETLEEDSQISEKFEDTGSFMKVQTPTIDSSIRTPPNLPVEPNMDDEVEVESPPSPRRKTGNKNTPRVKKSPRRDRRRPEKSAHRSQERLSPRSPAKMRNEDPTSEEESGEFNRKIQRAESPRRRKTNKVSESDSVPSTRKIRDERQNRVDFNQNSDAKNSPRAEKEHDGNITNRDSRIYSVSSSVNDRSRHSVSSSQAASNEDDQRSNDRSEYSDENGSEERDFFDPHKPIDLMTSDGDDEFDDDEYDEEYDGFRGTQLLSIKAEPIEVKRKGARQRWAQQARLKASTFLANTKSTGRIAAAAAAQAAALRRKDERLATLNKWYHSKLNNVGRALQNKRANVLWGMRDDGADNALNEVDPNTLISLEELISNSKMIRYYAAWLEEEDQAKLSFLCSVEEYRAFLVSLYSRYDQSGGNTGQLDTDIENILGEATSIIFKYLDDSAQFHIGSPLLPTDQMERIEITITMIANSKSTKSENRGTRISALSRNGNVTIDIDRLKRQEDLMHVFDEVEIATMQTMISRYPLFRKTDLYEEMMKSVSRDIYALESILLNHRYANYYWVFLFQHNYHREMALWLEVEYGLKPLYWKLCDKGDESCDPIKSKTIKSQSMEAAKVFKLLKYISMKYFAGDEDMEDLDKNIPIALVRLVNEQVLIVEKLRDLHKELYSRFTASKAYAEFAVYPNATYNENSGNPTNGVNERNDYYRNMRRLSMLLRNYGLRAHLWPEDASNESREKHSLDNLRINNDQGCVKYLVTLESIADEETGNVECNLLHHQVPSELVGDNDDELQGNIEDFLLPMCKNREPVVYSATCPSPSAFNTHLGEGATELFGACLIIYQPAPFALNSEAPPRRSEGRRSSRVHSMSTTGCRWMPYGICLLSSYPLLNTLRERLAEHFQANPDSPWKLTDSDIENLCRPYIPSPPVRLNFTASSCFLPLFDVQLPSLDFTLQLLFETLDVTTIVLVFTSILLECRIVFVSSYYTVMAQVAESFRVLMYPLVWPHVFVPIIPGRMLSYLQCPTPFVFGVQRDLIDSEVLADLGEEVICVDLDRSTLIQGDLPFGLPAKLLKDIYESIYSCLKPTVTKSDHVFYDSFPRESITFPESHIRSIFYALIMEMIGNFGYYRYTWEDDLGGDSVIIFDEASYLASSSPPFRQFRTAFIATQAFSEFVTTHNGFVDDLNIEGDAENSPEANKSVVEEREI